MNKPLIDKLYEFKHVNIAKQKTLLAQAKLPLSSETAKEVKAGRDAEYTALVLELKNLEELITLALK